MKIIESKIGISRELRKGIFLFVVLNGFLILFLWFGILRSRSLSDSSYMGFVAIALFVIPFDYFAILYLLRNYPKIKIYSDSLTIHYHVSMDKIYFREIKRIDYTGFKPKKKFFYSYSEDTLEIETSDGRKFSIFVDSYRNSKYLRQKLAELVDKKSANDFILSPIDEIGFVERFNKWSIFVSSFLFINYFTVAWLVFGILAFKHLPAARSLSFLLFLASFVSFLISTSTVNYIQCNDKYLIVRNNLKPWKRKVLRLDDILGVIFENTGGRLQLKMMSVTLKDFTKKSFALDSVGRKGLHHLQELLISKGIKVDGIIY